MSLLEATTAWIPAEASQGREVRAFRAGFDGVTNWQVKRPHRPSSREKGDPDQVALSAIFAIFKNRWITETATSSDLDEVLDNRFYGWIVGQGPQMVPLILQDLVQHGTELWHEALFKLTGVDLDAGGKSTAEQSLAWVRWGQDQGLID